MRKNVFEYTVPAVEGCMQSPSLRALELQPNGALWGAFIYSSAPLQRFEWDPKDGNVVSVQSEGVEDILGGDCIGIWSGIRSSSTGDTILAAWHRGSIPSFINLFGSDIRKADALALEGLVKNDSGGASIRHTLLEMNSGEWQVRRGKEPGVLTDVAIIGDYVFGLTPKSVFREPYLKTEKREVLRSDLQSNLNLCRDASGTFWFQAANGRLLRMALADLKPKMTPLKVAGAELGISDSSAVDGWMYVVTQSGKQLVRIRMNPITLEEELQVVSEFEGRVDAIKMVDHDTTATLFVAESLKNQGTRILAYALSAPDDPELIGPAPTHITISTLEGVDRIAAIAAKVQALEGEAPRNLLWLASSPTPGATGDYKYKLISLIDV